MKNPAHNAQRYDVTRKVTATNAAFGESLAPKVRKNDVFIYNAFLLLVMASNLIAMAST